MGVTTTADLKLRDIDDKLDDIKKVIRENLKDIRVLTIEAFDSETWGYDEYTEGVDVKYNQIANDLQEVLTKLNKF